VRALRGQIVVASLGCAAVLAAAAPRAGSSAAVGTGLAQSTPLRPQDPDVVGQVETRHLRVNLRLGQPKAPIGARATLVAEVVPKTRMHVYAPGQPGYVSVELKLAASTDYKAAPPVFPAAKQLYLEPIKETVSVYDAAFRITQPITLTETPELRRRVAAREPLTIAGTLRYQACDDAVCYRPETTPLTWTVPLASGK
jgi:hypothetical protein